MIDIAKLQTIIDALRNESDRGCAIIGLATTDVLLGDLIKAAMVEGAPNELFESQGACSTLSGKVDIAYALGLISADDRRDLHLLRKIRNEFAHAIDHELDCDDSRISNWIRELRIPRLFKDTPMLQCDNVTTRYRFELTIAVMNLTLCDFRKREVRRPPSPTGLKVQA